MAAQPQAFCSAVATASSAQGKPVCISSHVREPSSSSDSNSSSSSSLLTNQKRAAFFGGSAVPNLASENGSKDKIKRHGTAGSVLQASRSQTVIVSAAGAAATVTEPATKVQFAASIEAPGGGSQLSLLGAGVREKKIAIISVRVYAVGIYAETSLLGSLAAFKGKSAEDLKTDPSFFAAIASAPVAKSIVIVLARDVEAAQFWNALNEALAPRLKVQGADDAPLKEFGGVLQSLPFKTNTAIYLTSKHPSSLNIAVAADATTLSPPSSVLATIESEPLVKALLDTYLGSDSVSKTLVADVASRVAAKL